MKSSLLKLTRWRWGRQFNKDIFPSQSEIQNFATLVWKVSVPHFPLRQGRAGLQRNVWGGGVPPAPCYTPGPGCPVRRDYPLRTEKPVTSSVRDG
jgi:hypothetical protein